VAAHAVKDETIAFFTYGAKMRASAMRDCGIEPRAREAAQLESWALAFDLPGIPVVEPAFASIAPREGSRVHGVLWWITPHQAERLNAFESTRYAIIEVSVHGERSGPVRARAYRNPAPTAGIAPSRRYLRLLVEGAREAGLPDDYVRAIEAVKAAYVPVLSEVVTVAWRAFLWSRRWLAPSRVTR
jgi:hypothetical protein